MMRLMTLMMAMCCGVVANPIPVGQLDREVLEPFLPLIYEEVAKEFTLQNDGRTKRMTKEYGYSFFKMIEGDRTYEAPPAFYQELGEKVCEALGHRSAEFNNVILSLYKKGFKLEPHVDVDASHGLGFYFDEHVYGLIIEADKTGHLYFVVHHGALLPSLNLEPLFSLKEKQGTIFSLEGAYRHAPFYHAVTPVSNQRISITLRTVRFVDESLN
ncbi:MAG: hypothetical protein P0S94_03660 [Simkaniaceae bacterium]|nr:hypothetical protein [Simkaniaceae bacterium]